jgi:hypothetical protein
MEPLAYLYLSQSNQEFEHYDNLLPLQGKSLFAALIKLKPSKLSIALLGVLSGSLSLTFTQAALADISHDDAYRKDYAGGGFYYIFDYGDAAKQVVFVPIAPVIDPLAVAKPIRPTPYQLVQPSPVSHLPSPASHSQCLKPGDSGADVRCLQDQLREIGYFNRSSTGYYGHITKAAVMAFQRDHGLHVDGVAGPQTLSLLNQLTGK